MQKWKSEDIKINGIKIHYYRTGEGNKPPLVLSHGFSDNGLCWTPVVRKLEKDYDVIMIDARGHGLTDTPDDGYTIPNMSNDLVGLIKELHLSKPILMGHSMGSIISAYTAAYYPDLISAIILEDPGFGAMKWMPPFVLKSLFKFFMKRVNKKSGGTEAGYRDVCRNMNSKWSDEEVDCWGKAQFQFSSDERKGIFNKLEFDIPWRDLFQKIKCPVLLITADKGLTKMKTAQEIQKLWKNITWVQLLNSGHNIRRDNFIGFIDALDVFLNRNK